MAVQSGLKPPKQPRPIDWLVEPFRRFAAQQASGGILLLIATAAALVWANSPWSESYEKFWHTYATISFGDFALKYSLAHWVNDGLMAIFFFVVGLEIKREVLVGELASFRRAALPVAAAVGGMVAPAGFYVLMNVGRETISGWAIPAATDIAFALGVLALLGPRVPISVKIFLTALAIVDDIGAVVIIGVFYTAEVSTNALLAAAGVFVLLIVLNRLGVKRPTVYAVVGIGLWLAFLKSGVHATVAGVLLALTVPARHRLHGAPFIAFAQRVLNDLKAAGGDRDVPYSTADLQAPVHALEEACQAAETPLQRMEHRLHPWVTYFIMPVFALANAGLALSAETVAGLGAPVGLGVLLGLVLGKPLGIGLCAWLAVRLGLAQMPAGVTWPQLLGAGILAGIGFTMSLFIAGLAFDDVAQLESAKIGILSASLIAGVCGFVLLRVVSKPRAAVM